MPTDEPRQQPAPTLRQLPPLDLPMVPFVAGGMAVWAVLGLVLLAMRAALAEQGRDGWIGICLAGFLAGIPGLGLMIVHDLNRRRRLSRARTPRPDPTRRRPPSPPAR